MFRQSPSEKNQSTFCTRYSQAVKWLIKFLDEKKWHLLQNRFTQESTETLSIRFLAKWMEIKVAEADTYTQLARTSSFMFWPFERISCFINLSETLPMPLSESTSKHRSLLSPGSICMASKHSQSSRYSSRKIDPSELAKLLMPTWVRREHWLRFIERNAGAEETSALNPTSEIRQAPFRETIVNEGNPFGTNALSREESDRQCPHRSSCRTWFEIPDNKKILKWYSHGRKTQLTKRSSCQLLSFIYKVLLRLKIWRQKTSSRTAQSYCSL